MRQEENRLARMLAGKHALDALIFLEVAYYTAPCGSHLQKLLLEARIAVQKPIEYLMQFGWENEEEPCPMVTSDSEMT